ncbi:hypothetical protein HGO34_13400 [Agrobacterium vitis]|uniref:Uncharacterized protein n=1 Tax=Agrobacterium vitis TaxID=373 RepID=A0AAE4WFV5_AGRVI|nr:hypothetical protein [Agrobacterium vitis]MCF1499643.1 hypothetical protein [Allorhizobium sp. Av2]MCM2440711.1 hypothetical protein [Agrobacterium vitis]MUZ59310.1 hypothetical protein [Agrobacterium vitis]MVA66541.1 hypothetical protein [Agrobacterium vitis]MVA87402.1 hypothetical protein [Agrobacterium vitis]
MSWKIVLDDGTRHEITSVQISYQIGTPTRQTIKTGTIDGDPDVLISACTDANVFVEAPNGTQHPVHVELINGKASISPR